MRWFETRHRIYVTTTWKTNCDSINGKRIGSHSCERTESLNSLGNTPNNVHPQLIPKMYQSVVNPEVNCNAREPVIIAIQGTNIDRNVAFNCSSDL